MSRRRQGRPLSFGDGIFVFRMFAEGRSGISPLALIQETLVVQVFDGERMGLAVALGLVVGKASSFIASFTTVPLALYTPLTYRTPFIVSTSLTFFSVLLNIVFVRAFSRPSKTSTLSNAEAHIRAHKSV